MALHRPPRVLPDDYNYCPICGGTGRTAKGRESWQAPIYGDDTESCRNCKGIGIIKIEEEK